MRTHSLPSGPSARYTLYRALRRFVGPVSAYRIAFARRA